MIRPTRGVQCRARARAVFISSVTLGLAGCVGGPPRAVHPGQAGAAAPRSSQPASTDAQPCVETHHGCIALNPDVTQQTIGKTICVSGYTRTVRPSTSFSNGVKSRLIREAGLDRTAMSSYELDHLVPLALGGHPRKLSNLRLQPWHGVDSAIEKDRLEVRLQHLVCSGAMSLAEAQHCIAADWHQCERTIEGERLDPRSRPRH